MDHQISKVTEFHENSRFSRFVENNFQLQKKGNLKLLMNVGDSAIISRPFNQEQAGWELVSRTIGINVGRNLAYECYSEYTHKIYFQKWSKNIQRCIVNTLDKTNLSLDALFGTVGLYFIAKKKRVDMISAAEQHDVGCLLNIHFNTCTNITWL